MMALFIDVSFCIIQELEGIVVRGKNCPKPIKTWAHCGVSRKIFEALKKHNFEKPTPIQAQAIPAIMSGIYLCISFVDLFAHKVKG